jgi:hypothetical protein
MVVNAQRARHRSHEQALVPGSASRTDRYLVSLNRTCFLAIGSYFFISMRSGCRRAFLVLWYVYGDSVLRSLIFTRLPLAAILILTGYL